jgi:hypothetical protein
MKKIIFISLLMIACLSIFGQRRNHVSLKNLQNFDKAKFHFGFILGYNKADFFTDMKPNTFASDSLLSLGILAKPGFNLGIVSSWNITPLFKLRFLPTLSFQERHMNYAFYTGADSSVLWNKKVESTFLDFPLLVKMRTERINNFAAYIVAGGKFGLDMQSNKDVENGNASLKEQIIKITKPDYGLEIGGGFDFFLEYFKFGLELRMGVGMKNLLIQENTIFSSPIDRLRSKVWTLSLTFEG